MLSFFKDVYDSLILEHWAEDVPSTWFLVDLMLASIGNIVFLTLAIIGLSPEGLRNTDTLNQHPEIYKYTIGYIIFLVLIVACAIKCTLCHPNPHHWLHDDGFDEQRKFYPFYMMGYVFLSPVGLVITAMEINHI